MIPDVNVLGALFRDGVLGDEDRALVITANRALQRNPIPSEAGEPTHTGGYNH